MSLALLFPEPERIEVQGRKVEIHPVALRDFDLFGRASTALFGFLADGSPLAVGTFGKEHGALLKQLITKTTSLSRWRIARLPASVAVQVAVQVVRVNAGFFAEAQAAAAVALVGLGESSS